MNLENQDKRLTNTVDDFQDYVIAVFRNPSIHIM